MSKNILLDFKGTLSIVDFMKVWHHYDSEQSGYLDDRNVSAFVRDLLEQLDMPSDDDSVVTYKAALLDTYDVDEDGRIGLYELFGILPVEHNFLSDAGADKLGKDRVQTIFDHYDSDKNGVVEGDELLALVLDLMRARDPGADFDAAAVAEYRSVVLQLTGAEDGRVDRDRLAALFA